MPSFSFLFQASVQFLVSTRIRGNHQASHGIQYIHGYPSNLGSAMLPYDVANYLHLGGKKAPPPQRQLSRTGFCGCRKHSDP